MSYFYSHVVILNMVKSVHFVVSFKLVSSDVLGLFTMSHVTQARTLSMILVAWHSKKPESVVAWSCCHLRSCGFTKVGRPSWLAGTKWAEAISSFDWVEDTRLRQ